MKKTLKMISGLLMGLALAVFPSFVSVAAEAPASPQGVIVIDEVDEAKGIKVGDTSKTVNEKWGTKLEDGYVVTYVGDAHVRGTVPEDYEQKITLADADIAVHYGKNKVEVFGKSFTLKASDLSPVIFLKKADAAASSAKPASAPKKSVNTSDNRALDALWGGSFLISVACACGAIALRKKEN